MIKTNYAMVTGAHNEEQYIGKTIESVLAQTVRPIRWVIVSDGSTDGTDDIVKGYAGRHDFIRLLRYENDSARGYSRITLVVNAGYDALRPLEFDYLANLDADIAVAPNYYERMIERFEENSRLGICCGMILEKIRGQMQPDKRRLHSTPGGLQMFRRVCWDQIGGYQPMRTGGVDTVAALMARMRGWETRSFPDVTAIHYRPTGMGEAKSLLRVRYKEGMMDYNLGAHPLFELVKIARRVVESPLIIGSAVRLFGYLRACAAARERDITGEMVKYARREQLRRIFSFGIQARKP